MSRSARLLRWAAATDRTFVLQPVAGSPALVGKCIHCGRALVVALQDGVPSSGTLEHIVPKSHGGTDTLENLAVACARCNHGKGRRLDHRPKGDPTLRSVIETLTARRRDRAREPLDGLSLGPPPEGLPAASERRRKP